MRGLAVVWAAAGAALGAHAQQVPAPGIPQYTALGSGPFGPGTWFVDASATPPGSGTFLQPYTDLAAALAAPGLKPGDSVQVAPGTYPGPVVAPAFGVTVRSTHGAAATSVDGLGAAPALVLEGTNGVPVVFDGFTFQNGAGTAVSPIFSAGGGVQALGARFVIENCVVEHNDAFWGGGVFAMDSVGTLFNTRVAFNTNTGFGARGGGVLADGGSLSIARCTIEWNASGDFFAPGNGGGIYAQGGVDLDVLDTRIQFNVAEFGGGGTYGPGDYLGCTLRGNVGQFGGGASATSGTVFTDCLIVANSADSLGGTSHFGGGVYGAATLDRCTVRKNVAWGGVAGVDGGLLLDCLVEDNLAIPGFGGVNTISGGLGNGVALDSTLARNVADGGDLYFALGGGASFSTLVRCDLEANEARPHPDFGGGGTYACDVRRSRLFDNLASGTGGGAWRGTLFRCLLFDNRAEAGGGAADADLDHCTLEGNRAALGDGLWMSAAADAELSSSIVYGNDEEEIAADPNALFTVSYSDVRGGWPGVGNIDADPRFWFLPGDDYHLLPGSPCIDAGDPLYKPDPDGSRTDMGAFRADPDHYPNADDFFGAQSKP